MVRVCMTVSLSFVVVFVFVLIVLGGGVQVSSNKQAGNNKPTTPGIGDIASYVKSSQTGSSTETSTLFQ